MKREGAPFGVDKVIQEEGGKHICNCEGQSAAVPGSNRSVLLHISIVLLHSKSCSAELPLRVKLIRAT